jgi:hypothetical protein
MRSSKPFKMRWMRSSRLRRRGHNEHMHRS